jgi:hypothetical protein
MTIHEYSFETYALRGTRSELMEQVRQLVAIHFGQCTDCFDEFELLKLTYHVTENEDGTFSRFTTAHVVADDEDFYDDEDDASFVNTSPSSPGSTPLSEAIDLLSLFPLFLPDASNISEPVEETVK